MSNPTKVFSEFVSDIQFSDLSSELIDIAKIPILDGFANMMAGSTQEVSGLVSQYVQSLGGNNQSTVIGHNYQTSTLLAAFINGVSGHCLDYENQGHPATHGTSSCLPSALALGENRGISGKQLILSYILGWEIQARMRLSTEGVTNGAYHPPGLFGPLGAGVAASKSLSFDRNQTALCLGILWLNLHIQQTQPEWELSQHYLLNLDLLVRKIFLKQKMDIVMLYLMAKLIGIFS